MKFTLMIASVALSLIGSSARGASSESLTGTVLDPQEKPVPGAVVTLFSSTGVASGTTTDSSGVYRFPALPQGDYLIRVEASGFAPFVEEDIRVLPGSSTARNVALQVAGVREQVVVTASSTPQLPDHVSKAISVIDQTDADTRDASTLSDVVALAPGVRVNQLGGPGAFTSIRIRGLRDQDTAVLIDGLRLRDASTTQADASGFIEDLLFTNADRVEVLRGSGSSLYGTNAIGGVINVITNEGGGHTRGNLLLEGGSLGTFRGRGQLSGGIRNDRIQYSLGLAQTDVINGVGGDVPFRDTNAHGRLAFQFSPSLRLIAGLFAANSFAKVLGEPDLLGSPSGLGIVNAIPLSPTLLKLYENGTPLSLLNTGNATFIPAPDNPDSTRAARFLSGALILNWQPSPNIDSSVDYQIVSSGRRYGDGPAGVGFQPGGSTRAVYDGRIQTVNAEVRYRLGRFNLLSGGYEFENENYANDNSDQSNPTGASGVNVTERSHTAFLQDQAQLFGGRLQLSGAFRAQFFTLNTPLFIPLASAPYQLSTFPAPPAAYTGDASVAYIFRGSGTKLRAHAGRGYRAPSLFERFGAGYDSVFGYSVYGDPGLKPEHSTSVDAGFDQTFFNNRLRTSASYFYTWLEDVINFDTSGAINPATDPFGRFIGYLNTQGGISRGLELNAVLAPASALRIAGAYTYVNAIERSPIVGNVLQSFVIPKNQFSLQVTERVSPRLLLMFDTLASSSYLAPVFGELVTQTYRFDGIHKVNLGASYRIPIKDYQAIRFFARAENIANQTYFESGFLTPGRTARGGLQFEF